MTGSLLALFLMSGTFVLPPQHAHVAHIEPPKTASLRHEHTKEPNHGRSVRGFFRKPGPFQYVPQQRIRFLKPGQLSPVGRINGNPDAYGWVDFTYKLPLGDNRTSEYYFPRYLTVPPEVIFLPTYYNPYRSRGQYYTPYTGWGGYHRLGIPVVSPYLTPKTPYRESLAANPNGPNAPRLIGTVESPPQTSSSTGLTP